MVVINVLIVRRILVFRMSFVSGIFLEWGRGIDGLLVVFVFIVLVLNSLFCFFCVLGICIFWVGDGF